MTNSPHEAYSIPGALTTDGCTIATGRPVPVASFPDDQPVYLVYNTTDDGSGYGFPDLTGATWVTLLWSGTSAPMTMTQLTGLTPGQVYHAGTARNNTGTIEWAGTPIRFRVLWDQASIPAEGAVSMKWAYGSCQFHWENNPGWPTDPHQYAWDDLAAGGADAEQPYDILWDTGDFHYQGNQVAGSDTDWTDWAQLYWDHFHYLSSMRAARALVPEDQISDDHEFSPNNGESDYPADDSDPMHKQSVFDAPFNYGESRLHQMAASQNIFAMYPLHDPTKGMYGTYMLMPNVRVIILDCESLERTWSQKSSGFLNFLGGAQYTWLKDLLTPVDGVAVPTVNLLIAGKAYIGSDWTPGQTDDDKERDKVWWYSDWRAHFATFLSELPESPKVNIVWVGGDRHWCAWDNSGTTYNKWGGFATMVGSGWSQTNLKLVPGEQYAVMQPPFGDGTGHGQQVYQYLSGTISNDHAGNVTIDTVIRYYDGTEMASDPTTGAHTLPFTNPN